MKTDIFILSSKRNESFIDYLRTELLISFSEATDEYYYPQYDDSPDYIFNNVDDLISKLIKKNDEAYSLYWNSPIQGMIAQVMFFFTDDGGIIIGQTINSSKFETIVSHLNALNKIVEGEYAYVSFGDVPPDSSLDFKLYCKKSKTISMVEGKLNANSKLYYKTIR